jgi:hypothetical protein
MIGGLILDSEMTHNLYTVDANVHLLEKKYVHWLCVLVSHDAIFGVHKCHIKALGEYCAVCAHFHTSIW